MRKKKRVEDPEKISGEGREFEICGETYTFRPLTVSDSLKTMAFWKMKMREAEAGQLKIRIAEETIILDACPTLSPMERIEQLRKVRDDYKAEMESAVAILDDKDSSKDERKRALLMRIEPIVADVDNCVEAYERLLFLGARRDHPELTMETIQGWALTLPVAGSISDALEYIKPEGEVKEGYDVREILGLDPEDDGGEDEKKTSTDDSPKKKSKDSSDTTAPSPGS